MPPKRARGARARGTEGRGRGRGRGRGAPVAEAQTPQVNEQDAASQSTIVDSPMPNVEPAANTTPVHQQDQHDPNSSPATQPTETPAPTPIRPQPVASSTDVVPAVASASGSGTRGTGALKPSKFKPKIIRANAKEREEREEREREKEALRLGAVEAAAAKQARILARGRGRGRGAAMGRGRGGTSVGGATGTFAVLPSVADRKGGFNFGGGGVKRDSGIHTSGGGGGGGMTAKHEGGGGSGSGAGGLSGGSYGGNHNPLEKRFVPDPEYPGDENDDSPRVNIEVINLASDDEVDDGDDVVITGSSRIKKGKASASRGGLRPIRLDRKEHKERVTIVNTENTVKPEQRVDPDVMAVDEKRSLKAGAPQRPWIGTYAEDVQVKAEPGSPEISFAPAPRHSSPAPSEFKVPVELIEDGVEVENEATKHEPMSPQTERKAKPRLPLRKKVIMPVHQTEEDRAEWGRHVEDLDILREELTGLAANDSHNKDKDIEGDVEMKNLLGQPEKKEAGRIYLFQFPPVIPKLYNESSDSNPNIPKPSDEEVQMLQTVDLTKERSAEVKIEEKVVEIKQEEQDAREEELRRKRRDTLVIEDGLIGRLIVRKSGQVELVWGGTNMKVSRGVETSFFSAGSIVDGMGPLMKDEDGVDIPPDHRIKGKSMSMGDIMGKFVVTPDWR